MGTEKTRSFGTAGGGDDLVHEDVPRELPRSAPIQPGTVLAGKYWIERVLAQGGMGTVVLARHLQLDELVAIKFLRDEIVSDDGAAARFAREARTAIKIKSEHVARIIDVDSLENGVPFMVMEYLKGEDLAAWILARGPLPIEQAVEFVLQACEAISEAHGLGIVHRDLKPPNLFVTRRADGIFALKVLDFGISRVAVDGMGATGTTNKRMVVGSPSYMSPEQLASPADVDARSDIWSLGVTLFEMLTGRLPFEGDTVPLLCGQILRDPPPLVRALREDVPREVETIIGKCLEKERAKRYPTVGDLAMALAPFGPERARASAARVWRTVEAAGLPSKAATEVAVASEAPQNATISQPTRVVWDQSAGGLPPKRHRVAPLGAAVLLTGLGLAALLTWARGSPSQRPAEPAPLEKRPLAGSVGESPSSIGASPSTIVEAIAPPPTLPAFSTQPAPADSRTAAHATDHAPAKTPVIVNPRSRSTPPGARPSGSAVPRARPSSVFDSRD